MERDNNNIQKPADGWRNNQNNSPMMITGKHIELIFLSLLMTALVYAITYVCIVKLSLWQYLAIEAMNMVALWVVRKRMKMK